MPSGNASITARGVTLRSRATSSITAPGFSAMNAFSSAISVLSMVASPFAKTTSSRGAGAALGLHDVEPLELRMLEIERTGGFVAGARMGLAEFLGLGPRLEA